MKDELTRRERLMKYVESQLDDSFKARQMKGAGYTYNEIKKLLEENYISRYSRGIYTKSDSLDDEFYLLQQKYTKGIYSHEIALYLHGYSDRIPSEYSMTFPHGYNASSLKDEYIIPKYVNAENHDLGLETIESPYGNTINVYNIERTLCDVIKGNKTDIYLVNTAFRQYVLSPDKDITKLMEYAEKLHVKNKVSTYLGVLL